MWSLSRAAAGQTYIQSLTGGTSQITLLPQEKVFSKAVFSCRDFVEKYCFFLPEIVNFGVAPGEQQRVDTLLAKEMLFSKGVFSFRDFVGEYSFLPEIVDCGVAQGEQRVIFYLLNKRCFQMSSFLAPDFVEEDSFLPEIVDCGGLHKASRSE
jgi:hypothetical protein